MVLGDRAPRARLSGRQKRATKSDDGVSGKGDWREESGDESRCLKKMRAKSEAARSKKSEMDTRVGG